MLYMTWYKIPQMDHINYQAKKWSQENGRIYHLILHQNMQFN